MGAQHNKKQEIWFVPFVAPDLPAPTHTQARPLPCRSHNAPTPCVSPGSADTEMGEMGRMEVRMMQHPTGGNQGHSPSPTAVSVREKNAEQGVNTWIETDKERTSAGS